MPLHRRTLHGLLYLSSDVVTVERWPFLFRNDTPLTYARLRVPTFNLATSWMTRHQNDLPSDHIRLQTGVPH